MKIVQAESTAAVAVAFSIDATGWMLQMLYNITFTREPLLQFSHFPPTIFNDVFLLVFLALWCYLSFELGEKYHRLVNFHTIYIVLQRLFAARNIKVGNWEMGKNLHTRTHTGKMPDKLNCTPINVRTHTHIYT